MNGALRRALTLVARESLVRLLASPAGTVGAGLLSRAPDSWERLVVKPVQPSRTPASEGVLRAWANRHPDTGRMLFSLAVRYAEHRRPADDRRSMACLRSAACLSFESPERILLYRELLESRNGAWKRTAANPLNPRDLTDPERALLEQARQSASAPSGRRIPEPHCDTTPTEMLVIGDEDALSAGWFPASRYILLSRRTTGLSLRWCSDRKWEFDVAFGSERALRQARREGIRSREWRPTVFRP